MSCWLCLRPPPSSLSLSMAPSSICFLLVYKEQLSSGRLHFLTDTCVVLFFFFSSSYCCYKSPRSWFDNIWRVSAPAVSQLFFSFSSIFLGIREKKSLEVLHSWKKIIFSWTKSNHLNFLFLLKFVCSDLVELDIRKGGEQREFKRQVWAGGFGWRVGGWVQTFMKSPWEMASTCVAGC